MKLSECIQYINSALNYPALTYVDINVFFDMAISELNTTLHTSIPTVKDMVQMYKEKTLRYESNKLILTDDPKDTDYVIPTEDPDNPFATDPDCYYSYETKKFYILNKYTHEYSEHDSIKGVYIDDGQLRLFQSMNYGASAAWAEIPTDPEYDADLGDYLPDDWILLWLIPYVCFKYTVRDGGTAQTFAEELSQGYQQLQETYNVPDKVMLSKYADKPAYTKEVEKWLPYLDVIIPTKAIYEDMKHSRNTNAIFGGFYDRGGF